jgi:hypothetical protein
MGKNADLGDKVQLRFSIEFLVDITFVSSRDNAVSIATGYGLDDRKVGVRVQVGARFSPLHVVQSGSGDHPAPIQWVTVALSPRVKRPGCEAAHSPPSSAEVKNTWIYTPLPYTSS